MTATESLDRANEIRTRRAALRRELHTLSQELGRERVAVLLEDPPEWLHSLPIMELLMWPFGTFPWEVRPWLFTAGGASELARIAGEAQRTNSRQNPGVLTSRQRAILAACLRGEL